MLCDVSCSPARPVVPSSVAADIVARAHNLTHAGGSSTLRGLRRRYVWSGMSSQVKEFCRSCVPSKVSKHTKSPLEPLDMPDARFAVLHLDLVGPLPAANGFSYLLTVIDRYSRWVEAIPLSSITAHDCAVALLHSWISRFGAPSSIITDRGRQFTSGLWA